MGQDSSLLYTFLLFHASCLLFSLMVYLEAEKRFSYQNGKGPILVRQSEDLALATRQRGVPYDLCLRPPLAEPPGGKREKQELLFLLLTAELRSLRGK